MDVCAPESQTKLCRGGHDGEAAERFPFTEKNHLQPSCKGFSGYFREIKQQMQKIGKERERGHENHVLRDSSDGLKRGMHDGHGWDEKLDGLVPKIAVLSWLHFSKEVSCSSHARSFVCWRPTSNPA